MKISKTFLFFFLFKNIKQTSIYKGDGGEICLNQQTKPNSHQQWESTSSIAQQVIPFATKFYFHQMWQN